MLFLYKTARKLDPNEAPSTSRISENRLHMSILEYINPLKVVDRDVPKARQRPGLEEGKTQKGSELRTVLSIQS